MTATETTWPDDVIIRYRTVGGATVDITTTPVSEHDYAATTAECLGCDARKNIDWVTRTWDTSIGDYRKADDSDGREYTATVRDWAQDHASTCRAMPKPGDVQ